MKRLPKTLTLHNIPDCLVTWKLIKVVEGKSGEVEVYMPVSDIKGLGEAREILKNILIKKPDGEYLKPSALELSEGCKISYEDVEKQLTISELERGLRRLGLEATEEALYEEAERLGGKWYNVDKAVIEHLSSKAQPVEVEEPELFEEEELVEESTDELVAKLSRDQDMRQRYPERYYRFEDMTDKQKDTYIENLRKAALEGKPLKTCWGEIPAPSWAKPEVKPKVEPEEEPEEELEDKSLFDLPPDAKKPVSEMSDEEFEQHIKEQKDDYYKKH